MNIVRKDATITPTGDDTDFPGTFEVVLSAPTKDRDGDTLLPNEWKTPLPEKITFDSDHGMSVATTVGSGAPRIDEKTGNLVVSGTFSSLPRAQEVRTLVKEGHIDRTSVAFMSERTQKDGVTVTKRELLNGAFVAIPSNREAVILSSKGLKAGARNSAADIAHVQAIHDHALALGADPKGGKPTDPKKAFVKAAGDPEAEPDDDPAALLQAVDAALDEAVDAFAAAGTPESLPAEIQQGIALVTAAQASVDHLLAVLGIPDADDEEADTSGSGSAPAGGAATAPIAGSKSVPVDNADSDSLKARAARLRFAQNFVITE